MTKGSLVFSLMFAALSCTATKPEKFEVQIPYEPPPESSENSKPIENPLIIEVKTDKRIFLNKKQVGTLNDLTELEKELSVELNSRKSAVIKDATTVFVRVPRAIKYGEAKKVIDLAKSVGAAPIGLQIDDLTQ